MNGTSIVWFRLDLRLEDNPALKEAADCGAVIPVFIGSPAEDGGWPAGAASRVWLHESLKSLDESLRKKGSRLIIRKGKTVECLRQLVRETGAQNLFWNRRYEPAAIARDTQIKESFAGKIQVKSFNSALLFEPWEIRTGSKTPYQVFTAFWNACLAAPEPAQPLPYPGKLKAPEAWPDSVPLESLGLLPEISWDKEIRKAWQPGESGAAKRLSGFLKQAAGAYDRGRDLPAETGTSRLSPHLHFGEIGPRQIWHAVKKQAAKMKPAERKSAEIYLKEIGWREFAHHLLFHFPDTPERPLKKKFASFPWKKDKAALKTWQKGMTGYPIVDAGMRELWATGWMHNRVRMITASFLIKDLLIPWQEGAKWFWDTLVDADLANNTLGWQWTAGCGADAAPFFRIFNPVSQGEKFDPHGAYIRKWVPELAALPDKWIHRPFEAPEPPRNYPEPIVNHAEARVLALRHFERTKG